MLIKKPVDIKPSEITPENVFRNRRQFMKESSRLMLGAAVAGSMPSIANAQSGASLKAPAPVGLVRTDPADWLKINSLVSNQRLIRGLSILENHSLLTEMSLAIIIFTNLVWISLIRLQIRVNLKQTLGR